MTFTSLQFFLFLIAVVGLFYAIPTGWRRPFLLAASYAFYLSWSVPGALLLLGSTGLCFWLSIRLEDAFSEQEKKKYLRAGVFLFLLLLAGCKYIKPGPVAGLWLIPVGISYYVLKLIGSLVDVYWGKALAERSFVSFALYVAFFPQILSGPIQRAVDFLPQLRSFSRTSAGIWAGGLRLLLLGLFKKMVIADNLGALINPIYDNPSHFSGWPLLLASYGFFFQIYADFSGYSDMAIGIARLFGIQTPLNFNAPLRAKNIPDFWRRWHMTLTSWLSDYLFTPLRMKLRSWGKAGLVLSLYATMLCIGLWHKATWTYAAFGLIHGTYLTLSALSLQKRNQWFKQRPGAVFIRRITAPFLTFHLVVFSFIFLRARTVREACGVIGRLFSGLRAGWTMEQPVMTWVLLLALAAVVWIAETFFRNQQEGLPSRFALQAPTWVRWAAYYAMGIGVFLCGSFGPREFIYSQF